jgi:hypothetical protein
LKEIPRIKPGKFNYVVQSGPYLIFVVYPADPSRYIVVEKQTYLVLQKTVSSHPDDR